MLVIKITSGSKRASLRQNFVSACVTPINYCAVAPSRTFPKKKLGLTRNRKMNLTSFFSMYLKCMPWSYLWFNTSSGAVVVHRMRMMCVRTKENFRSSSNNHETIIYQVELPSPVAFDAPEAINLIFSLARRIAVH